MAFPEGRDSSETHPAEHTCHPDEVSSQELEGNPPPPRQPAAPGALQAGRGSPRRWEVSWAGLDR